MVESSAPPASSNEAALTLARWGARFASADTEAAYQDRLYERGARSRFTRVAAAGLSFAAISVGLLVSAPDRLAAAAMPLLLSWILFGIVVTLVMGGPLARPFVPVAMFALQAVGSSAMVYCCASVIGLPRASVAMVVVMTYFQFGATSMRPTTLALSILPFVSIELVLVADPPASTADVIMARFVMIASFALSFALSVASQRLARRAYAQERTIEEQQFAITRERARSEELLKRELSHQVAERSRELGAILAQSAVTLDVRRLSPGERFAERYRIAKALGAGGMGAVYAVERVTDGEMLALKVVVGEVSAGSAARFAREAEIGARVRHPNLVSIVDVGVSGGVPFLAMELVRGGSLENQRARFGDVVWALPILRQIAEGLAALHDAGVVHRDLKPANVLLTEGGAKISDFGISRFGAVDAAAIDATGDTMAATPKKSAELTGTGVVMGTPLYMAPEGAKSARTLDSSADVFAFGIIAYEMITGKAAFAVPAFLLATAEQPIPVPPAIDDAHTPRALRALIASSLAGDPAQRPRVRALLAALA